MLLLADVSKKVDLGSLRFVKWCFNSYLVTTIRHAYVRKQRLAENIVHESQKTVIFFFSWAKLSVLHRD